MYDLYDVHDLYELPRVPGVGAVHSACPRTRFLWVGSICTTVNKYRVQKHLIPVTLGSTRYVCGSIDRGVPNV